MEQRLQREVADQAFVKELVESARAEVEHAMADIPTPELVNAKLDVMRDAGHKVEQRMESLWDQVRDQIALGKEYTDN